MHRSVALLTTFLLAACAQEIPGPEQIDTPTLDGELPDVFVLAAEQYDVPAELVMVLAWHESSFVAIDGDHDEHRPAFGWMGLTPDRVEFAAEVTGADPDAIETETDINVRAGAAVLGALRDEIAPDAPTNNVDARWWPVILAWPELDEEWMDHQFAADVFRTVQIGLDTETPAGDTVYLEGQRIPGLEDVDFVHAPTADAEERSAYGYPGRARWHPAHSGNQSGRSNGVNSVNRVVLHTTEGSYNGAISWFRNNSSNVSAHYVIRKSDGEVTQMVGDDRKAWHACGNNNDTIGIEHEGAASNPSTWTSANLDASARLTAWLVTQYDIPIDRDHIVGHGEIQPSNCSGRTDPGSHFPWADYMQMVATYAGAPTPTPDPVEPGNPGPLTFLSPAANSTVPNPVGVSIQHPQSHIELWQGPALLVPFIYDHPAQHQVTFGSDGPRALTARAYWASGSHIATRTVHFEVGEPLLGDDDDAVGDDDDAVGDDDDSQPDPVDTTLYSTNEQHIAGSTMRFTATAGADVAYIEYWIDTYLLPDDATAATHGTPTDYALTYTFNYTGDRNFEARAFDADGNLTGTISKVINVPTEACGADVCIDAFPATDNNTTVGATSNWDYYSCAPSTNESGPEIVYGVTVPMDGFLTATIDDPAGVDVDVHILSDFDPSSCLDRGHHEAGALVEAGTVYISIDSWVNSSGDVFDGAYELTLGLATATGYTSVGLDAAVMADAIDVFGAAWEDGETDSFVYTIIDFSLSSTVERLWTIDLTDGSLIWNLHVSHGEASTGSSADVSDTFSNINGSHQSSLGLASTAETYTGSNGYSLRMDGLDPGYNDAVRSRYIVVHGATYSRPEFAASNGYLGRSWGCPAIDDRHAEAFIDDIKGGSLVLSWYPDGDWSDNSPWLQ